MRQPQVTERFLWHDPQEGGTIGQLHSEPIDADAHDSPQPGPPPLDLQADRIASTLGIPQRLQALAQC